MALPVLNTRQDVLQYLRALSEAWLQFSLPPCIGFWSIKYIFLGQRSFLGILAEAEELAYVEKLLEEARLCIHRFVFIEGFGPPLEAFFSFGVDGFVDGFGLVYLFRQFLVGSVVGLEQAFKLWRAATTSWTSSGVSLSLACNFVLPLYFW